VVAEQRDKTAAGLVAAELGATRAADGTYRRGALDGQSFEVVVVIWSARPLTAIDIEASASRLGARSLAIVAGPRGFGRSAEEAATRKGITLVDAELWPTLRLRRHDCVV
jgi:hypothetical protein